MALQQLGLNYRFEIIVNKNDILEYGVAKTPSLVVNGKVILEGRVPSILEMPGILKSAFHDNKK